MTQPVIDAVTRRPFGATGLTVPPLSVGCAPLGDMPSAFAYSVSEEDALATVRATLDSDMPYLDTAAAYGDGESERRVGIVLRERGGLPSHAVLETKIGAEPDGRFDAASTRRRFERSLSLLGLDRIEIVFLHDPETIGFDAAMAPNGPVETLLALRDEGLIGHVGVAGGPIDLMIRLVETGAFAAIITHNRFTLLNRGADPLLTVAHERGLAVLNAAPYGSGILVKGPSAYPRYAYQEIGGPLLDRALRLEAICDEHGVPLAAAALQFSMRDPRVTSTVIGMSRPSRLTDTLAFATTLIPDAVWNALAGVSFDCDDPEQHRPRS